MIRVALLRVVAVLMLIGGVVPLANILTDGRAVGWYPGAVFEWLTRGLVLVVLLWAADRLWPRRLDAIIARGHALLERPSDRAFAIGVAVFALVSAAFVARWAFAGQPFTSDEMAQLFHARVIASGHIAAVPDSLREFFNTAPVFDRDGRWFSQYPIGGPYLMSLGVVLGAPWLVNPVLFAVATLAFFTTLRRASPKIARGAILLWLTSPMVLAMAGSQMNHVPALFFAITAFSAMYIGFQRPELMVLNAAICGLSLGAMATIRPFDAALVGIVIGATHVAASMRDRKRWKMLAVEAVAAAVPVALLLLANARTTGGAFTFGYDALNGPEHGLGFHVDPNGDDHTLLRGIAISSGYLMRLSLFLFEWPVPGVLVIALGLWLVREPSPWATALAAVAGLFVLGYAAYWFDGFFAGPRFLFTAVPAFIYFAARAPGAFVERWPALRRPAMLFLPLCVLTAWFGPWGVSSASARLAEYPPQRSKLKTDVDAQIAREGIKNALVFVPEDWNGELQMRLRVLGANQFLANRISRIDPCQLQLALDAEEASRDADSLKLRRLVQTDYRTFLTSQSTPPTPCAAAAARDSAGTMPYAMFLAKQRFGRDGRVGGNVVFARDRGARDELLRARFGDRIWYRYRPAQGLEDTSRVFVPYKP